MSREIPAFEDFSKASAAGNILALSVTIHFDQETAITLADRFSDEEHFFLLESATSGPGGIARYSFAGFDPLWTFAASENSYRFEFEGQSSVSPLGKSDPVQELENHMQPFKLAVVGANRQLIDGVDLCSMGGSVGYFSYDMTKILEPSVGKSPPKQFDLPLVYFFMPRNFLVLDQLCRKLTVIRYVYADGCSAEQLKQLYIEETTQLEDLLKRIQAPHQLVALQTQNNPIAYDQLNASFAEADFLKQVKRCLKEVGDGEIFQVQIGNRLSLKTTARPFDIFRHLRILNPSPYMVFYRFGKHHIVCASPEMMVNVSDQTVTHRPIAGTRRRTWDQARDQKAKAELANDDKEKAEHVMLVDLSRNDLGRVAAPGSVQVDELMIVEEYSHVFHLVSQVSAQIQKGMNSYDAMIASFPNGTVSGAPKIRAMQIINEIEPVAREFYAGSLAVFDFKGDLKSTILIRTIYVADGVAATQASAGIVYDSIPKHEWQETRNKMAACLLAMQNTL